MKPKKFDRSGPHLPFVDNVDEIFSELKQKRVEIESPLQQYPYGLREFAFIDINGYYIQVAEGVENE